MEYKKIMISINDMPSFGFGNRLFYYNNLRQFAAKTGYDWSCCPWDGYQYFKGDLLNGSQVVDGELKLCLGEKFFENPYHSFFASGVFSHNAFG